METKLQMIQHQLIIPSPETAIHHEIESHVDSTLDAQKPVKHPKEASEISSKKLILKQEDKKKSPKAKADYFEYEDGYKIKKNLDAVKEQSPEKPKKSVKKLASSKSTHSKSENIKKSDNKENKVSSKRKAEKTPEKVKQTVVAKISVNKTPTPQMEQEDLFDFDDYQIKKKTVAH
jgi:hypothetical protein